MRPVLAVAGLAVAAVVPLAAAAVLDLPGQPSPEPAAGRTNTSVGPEAAGESSAAAPATGGEPSAAAPSAAGEASAAAPSATTKAAVKSGRVRVVNPGDGDLQVVPGRGLKRGRGPVQRYTVAVEGGLGVDARAFAATVDATLADRRSWGAGGRLSFQRVARGPVAFRVVLASPDTTDRLCAPLRTAGTYSCASKGAAVVNSRRWLRGAQAYRGDLSGYRRYVVNHEVGHTLGHGHVPCPAKGQPAPVMMQQTKGLGACRRNSWPFPS